MMQIQEREGRSYRLAAWVAVGLLVLIVVPVLAFRESSSASIAGRVTCGGKTVALGTVVAMAADGSVHTATIDPEGRYTIAKVPAGTVRLGVISRDPVKVQLKQTKLAAKSDRLTEADRGIPSFANGWFAIPAKYEDPLGSGLELAIKGPQVFNIQLP